MTLGDLARRVVAFFVGQQSKSPKSSNEDRERLERDEWNGLLQGMTPEQQREAIRLAKVAIAKWREQNE